MSERRRRYSIYETKHTIPLIEEREPEIYNPSRQRRHTVVFKTTVYRRSREHLGRSPSPLRHWERRSAPSPPPQLPSPPSLDDWFTMSPTDSPAPGRKYVPLPKPLPTKEDSEEERPKKNKKSSKAKPKVHGSGHKPVQSYDTGHDSASPYSLEERSPDLYSPNLKSPKPMSKPDATVYEFVDGKTRKVRYIIKDGKRVCYVSRSPDSPIDKTLASAKSSDPYKNKYKEAKQTTLALREALADQAEATQYNYAAARDQEAKHLLTAAQISTLEEELRRSRLQAQISEGRAAEADRKRMVAERKLREQDMERELEEQRQKRVLRGEEFARRQWEEIEASPSPVKSRLAQTPLIEQPRKPARKDTSGYSTSYNPQAMATSTQSPSILATTGNPFLDPILEAQRDYDLLVEDRRRATGVEPFSGRRERRRTDPRYK